MVSGGLHCTMIRSPVECSESGLHSAEPHHSEHPMLLNLSKKRFWTIFCLREPFPVTKGRTKPGRHLILTPSPRSSAVFGRRIAFLLFVHTNAGSPADKRVSVSRALLGSPSLRWGIESMTSWPEPSPSGEPVGIIHQQILFSCQLSPPPKLKSLKLKQNILFCLFMGWFSIV